MIAKDPKSQSTASLEGFWVLVLLIACSTVLFVLEMLIGCVIRILCLVYPSLPFFLRIYFILKKDSDWLIYLISFCWYLAHGGMMKFGNKVHERAHSEFDICLLPGVVFSSHLYLFLHSVAETTDYKTHTQSQQQGCRWKWTWVRYPPRVIVYIYIVYCISVTVYMRTDLSFRMCPEPCSHHRPREWIFRCGFSAQR